MRNRIGLHANYFRGTAYENDIFAIARCIHSAGGNVLELMPSHILQYSQAQLLEFRELLDKYDIELICGAGRSPATDASSDDPQVREASYQASMEILPLIHMLGCRKWDGLVHACWPAHPGQALTFERKEQLLERSAAEMRRILPVAEDLDIDICFELVNRFEHYLLNSVEEGIAYCQRLNHPRAKLLIDIFHMNIEEDSLEQAFTAAYDSGHLKHLHICEANRSMPGTVPSHIDWDSIFDTLVKTGYSDSIVIEPFVVGGTPFSTTVSIWRDQCHGGGFEWMKNNVAVGIEFAKEKLCQATKRADAMENE